jgi:hypothetical protein
MLGLGTENSGSEDNQGVISVLIDHIDYTVINDCINAASYGEICVKCNACGRFNKETRIECALELWTSELHSQFHFDAWFDDEEIKARQRQNIESNIEFFQDKILRLLADAMGEG